MVSSLPVSLKLLDTQTAAYIVYGNLYIQSKVLFWTACDQHEIMLTTVTRIDVDGTNISF